MLTQAAVHTEGINWESVAAIVSIVITVVGGIFGIIARMVSNRITTAIDRFRIEVVGQLDTRLTRVEEAVEFYGRRRR
jgi:hypothetical protein